MDDWGAIDFSIFRVFPERNPSNPQPLGDAGNLENDSSTGVSLNFNPFQTGLSPTQDNLK
ncbi:hypothetical protein CKA32_002079 [Geitlerinema sp. FC II]|nr:hypothetical protein CKA32_002079 [Geitlerinema sp. FC II]